MEQISLSDYKCIPDLRIQRQCKSCCERCFCSVVYVVWLSVFSGDGLPGFNLGGKTSLKDNESAQVQKKCLNGEYKSCEYTRWMGKWRNKYKRKNRHFLSFHICPFVYSVFNQSLFILKNLAYCIFLLLCPTTNGYKYA